MRREERIIYYVYRRAGEVRRLARIVGGYLAYAYEGGGWIERASLIRIIYELTEYEEISEAEALALIEEGIV